MKQMLIGILLILAGIGICFLISAGLVWIGCFALRLLGFSVVFSWKLAFAIWILASIIRFAFCSNND